MVEKGYLAGETEKAYPIPATGDKEGEYSYLYTECGNKWYSITKNPMYRDNCICPKCRKIIKVIMSKEELK